LLTRKFMVADFGSPATKKFESDVKPRCPPR
jgi:hypothetical protein